MKNKFPEFIVESQPELKKKVDGKPLHIHRIKEALDDDLKKKRDLVQKHGELVSGTQERVAKLEELSRQMGSIEESNALALETLREQIGDIEWNLRHDLHELEMTKMRLARATANVRREAVAQLEYHTQQVLERWEDLEYSEADIEKYFSEAYLEKLSVDEYIILMRRFPGEMVTHVTRQGVRDHADFDGHRAGLGEYSDGFVRIVESGRLQSTLGNCVTQEMKESLIVDSLNFLEFKTKEDALRHFRNMVSPDSQGRPGVYSDDTAVHFASEQVSDCYYGAEHGNEIFFAFPSVHIASNYFHEGHLTSSGGGYWNDRWIWAQEHKGININAGLVFIPGSAQVDKTTGSRYQLDAEKKPKRDGDGLLLASDTISSREYWEAYFSEHPEQRPSKVVYYDGDDPTAALNMWRRENNIKKSASKEIGSLYSARHIDRSSSVPLGGAERFLSIAEMVIEKYFEK